MKYDVNHYIQKFESIPENKWGTKQYKQKIGFFFKKTICCALGHCGYDNNHSTLEGKKLNKLFLENGIGSAILLNDSPFGEYQQPTPKQRILAALYDIKKMQEAKESKSETPQPKEIIRYVSVPESIKEQAKELIEN